MIDTRTVEQGDIKIEMYQSWQAQDVLRLKVREQIATIIRQSEIDTIIELLQDARAFWADQR